MSILQTTDTLPFKYPDFSSEMARIVVNSNLLIGKLQQRAFIQGSQVNILNPMEGALSGLKPDTYQFNWQEETIRPKITSLTAIAGVGTTFTVADSSIFRVNEILRITLANNKKVDEKVLITAIPTSTTLTVERDFGFGGSGQPAKSIVNLASGDEKIIFSHILRAEAQEGVAESEKYTLPIQKTNYVELFSEAARITRTQIDSKVFGINEEAGQIVLEQFRQKYISFIRQIDSALINGLYNSTALGSSGQSYQTGGILEFVEGRGRSNSDNVINANNTQIAESQFTDLFKYLGASGCQTKDFAIVCNRTQSAKISTFATAGTNPVVYKEYKGMGLEQGQSVAKINSNIADGTSGQIIISESVDEDKIYILDLSKIKVKPAYYQPFTKVAYDGGQVDKYVVEARLGFEIRNGDTCHGVIKNLSV
jgi:hypothetical protein